MKKFLFLMTVATLSLLFFNRSSASEDILWQNNTWGDIVYFSPRGDLLTILNSGQSIMINSNTGIILKTFNLTSNPSIPKFSHNGKIFGYTPSDNGIIFINTDKFDTLRISKIKSDFFDFSFDDKYFLTAKLTIFGIFINKYDFNTDSLISSFSYLFQPEKYEMQMGDFSVLTANNIVAFIGNELVYVPHDKPISKPYCKIINLDSNKIIGDFVSFWQPTIKFSTNGVLAAIDNGNINFYDFSGKLIKTLLGSHRDFCFNEKENEIITATSTDVKIWDYNTIKLKSSYYNPVFATGPGLISYSNQKNILIVISNGKTYAFDFSYIDGVIDKNSLIPNIQIIPNPTGNQVTISIQKDNIQKIFLIITDLTGNKLLNQNFLNINSNTFTTSINTATLPSGTLFFNLTIDDKQFTKQVKIIK